MKFWSPKREHLPLFMIALQKKQSAEVSVDIKSGSWNIRTQDTLACYNILGLSNQSDDVRTGQKALLLRLSGKIVVTILQHHLLLSITCHSNHNYVLHYFTVIFMLHLTFVTPPICVMCRNLQKTCKTNKIFLVGQMDGCIFYISCSQPIFLKIPPFLLS